MEQNTPDGVDFYLLLDRERSEDLAGIRGWKNLKLAFEEKQLWIKGFEYAQIHSPEVKSIPFAVIFYGRGALLFKVNSLLPDRIVPSLLWTPIERALPISLPSFNHNYFGLEDKIYMQLVPAEGETEAVAMITTFEHLQDYITSAPAVRLRNMQWVLLGQDQLLLYGAPLLPIKGSAYWAHQDLLLPAGYDFELYLLKDVLIRKINPGHHFWVIWNTDSTYFLLGKNKLKPLSLGGFRKTMEQIAPR